MRLGNRIYRAWMNGAVRKPHLPGLELESELPNLFVKPHTECGRLNTLFLFSL